MGILRRRGRSAGDADLPLSPLQVRRLHQLVEATLARAGIVVRPVGDELVAEGGGVYPLRDLAAECATEPTARWPGLVERHVEDVLAPGPSSLAELPDHTLLSAGVLRLVPTDSLPEGWDPDAPRVTEDLTSVVTLDLGDEALTPSASALTERAPHVPWREQARDNLRARARGMDLSHDRVAPVDDPEAGFDLLVGESGLVASTSLVLDEVLERVEEEDRGRGVLVGVPYRHQVVLRVVDGPGAARSIGPMADYLGATHAAAPGPLSPLVHWVHHDDWLPVTRAGDDGGAAEHRLAEALDPEVAQALDI
ncbi:MAG: hypothetical protein ACO1ON_13290 [Nocardioides sp.]